MIERPSLDGEGLENLIRPVSDLEISLLKLSEFRYGMLWGEPRFGHPEGKVAYHVREVLDNVEKVALPESDLAKLRLIALVHDTFKYEEIRTLAQGNRVHHGKLARDFMESYTNDEQLLTVIELHDEAYYCWRTIHFHEDKVAGYRRLDQLMERVEGFLPLYYAFFKCDTRTGDKIQTPIKWFEKNFKDLELIEW